jgi:capsular polysaccharide biosynthesis protein
MQARREDIDLIQIQSHVPLAHQFASDITERVDVARFASGRNVSILAADEGSMDLVHPVIRPESASSFHIQKPAGMPPKPEGFLTAVDFPAMALSRLDEAICLPGGVALSSDKVILSDIFAAPWDHMHHHVRPAEDGRYQLHTEALVETRLSGRYLYLDYQHFDHYGHFLMDVMSRLWAYDYALGLGVRDLKVLIRASPTTYAHDLLRGYGVDPDRIVEIDRPLVCEELFVASKSLQIQEYVSPHADQIWRKVRDGARKSLSGLERIYVSRSRHPIRSLTNEHEVEAIFEARGFKVLHPQELEAADQVTAFANAQLIAGASGTNMFNLAFQDRLTSALIITSPFLIHYSEQFLNGGRPTELQYFIGAPDRDDPRFNQHDVNSPWKIPDLDALARAVDDWITGATK